MPSKVWVLIACIVAVWPLSARAADVFGTWLTGDGQARIKLEHCKVGLCGTIVWLREPIDSATGRPPVDEKNRDPAKRQQPIIGLQILSMRPAGDGKWSGAIYNSDDGNTYQATITLQSATSLLVHGCAGLLCGDDTWTRVGQR